MSQGHSSEDADIPRSSPQAEAAALRVEHVPPGASEPRAPSADWPDPLGRSHTASPWAARAWPSTPIGGLGPPVLPLHCCSSRTACLGPPGGCRGLSLLSWAALVLETLLRVVTGSALVSETHSYLCPLAVCGPGSLRTLVSFLSFIVTNSSPMSFQVPVSFVFLSPDLCKLEVSQLPEQKHEFLST